ncbi:RHS repeat-associated protein [Aequitasia blattaphilus]|uniref:DUF6531 domain-containing protein n=1 Tax=Aequitasia blattaphilus TaxID=2949332 RepID=A0ABT1EB52_9FIRM|nr:DUF6531 domain-containing protein [Aequitasia blattaphilus]MCP1103070.1 DUF6531 domain-containing protein [Aequitasia blattaphilus]MCR8615710.1 DUF6531 domain-containing protein [Aequitasia blattaphilus]
MDRVFDQDYINETCSQAKSALEEIKDAMEYVRELAGEVEAVIGRVPADVRNNNAYTSISGLRQAIDAIDIDSMLHKLDDCRENARLIQRMDTQYAAETKALTQTINQIKERAASMGEFLVTTSLNSPDFMAKFDVEQRKWNQVMEDADAALDTILSNVKGAETISAIFSKDPVNLSTGNFIYDKTDLEIQNPVPFTFRRFYNSINRRKGSLGRDWNHNYEVRLLFEGEEVILLLEEGKEERFLLQEGKEKLFSIYHSKGELSKSGDTYIYEKKGGMKYFFDGKGRCQKVENQKGLLFQYTYAGESLSVAKVEKETGEYFAFTYEQDGYLQTVSDHNQRTVTYEIEKGLLKNVVSPKGNQYRYEYDSKRKLQKVINPRGITLVENTFDEGNRTIHQAFPDEGSMSYDYDDEKRKVTLTERNGSQVSYYHDEKFRDIRHVYHNGEEKFTYNQLNQKTSVTDKLGRKTQYNYDEKGNLTRIINPLGLKTEITYNEKNLPTSLRIGGQEKFRNRYDETGNLIQTIDALGNRQLFQYEKPGLPQKIQMPNGGEITLCYDKRGNILRIVEADGDTTEYAYDCQNRVIATKDAFGNTTKYTYDAEDNLLEVENAKGEKRHYEYNQGNKVTQICDFDKTILKREYNELGKPCKIIDQEGRETLLHYDRMWNLARVTEANGAKTTYVYNEDNLLGRVRNGNGEAIRYTYDPVGNRTSIKDEEGNQTFFAYDALNRLVEVKDEKGVKESYAYDGEGNLIEVRDALGLSLTLTYDAMGNLIREEGREGEKREYTYNANGVITEIWDEAGGVTKYDYTLGGKLREVSYPDQTKEIYTYNQVGEVETYTNRKEYVYTYYYDCLHQLIKIEGAQGETRAYTYDAVGNLTGFTDEEGNATTYRYSPSGQLVGVVDALGHETTYTYDAVGRLESVPGTTYQRDLMGNITKVIDGVGNEESYHYDSRGLLLSKVDQEGYLTSYAYNREGDLQKITYEDGKEVKLSYDALRHLKEIEDWGGITRIENDTRGRAKKVTYPDGKEVSYTYGPSGERRSIRYPDGKEVFYSYDKSLRLKGLKSEEQELTYAYDQRGNLIEKKSNLGFATSYAYNQKGQMESLVHQKGEEVLDSYTYAYNQMGLKSKVHKNEEELSYTYDPIGRLLGVEKAGNKIREYAYDHLSNRIRKIQENQKTEYTYNSQNQLIKETDGVLEKEYAYDKRGNLKAITENNQLTHQYTFGAMNRLEKAQNFTLNQSAAYLYNGLGHRVGKRVGEKEVLDILDLTKDYHNLLERSEGEEHTSFTWDFQVVSGRKKEESFFYFQDDLGSPIHLLSSNGQEDVYQYDEFGNQMMNQESSIPQPFTYTGYQMDSIAGTYYAQAREYQPQVGRFISEDVIKGNGINPVTMNQYTYCWNRPMDLVDRDGKMPDGLTHDDIIMFYEHPEYLVPYSIEGNGPGGYDDDVLYHSDVKGPSLKIKPSTVDIGKEVKKDSTIGLNIISVDGGIGKVSYKDNKGLLQSILELEVVHGGANIGINTKNVGAKLYGTLVSLRGKVLALEVLDKRIYIGADLDLFSVGIKASLDIKKKEFTMGASEGVGFAINITWEERGQVNDECEVD